MRHSGKWSANILKAIKLLKMNFNLNWKNTSIQSLYIQLKYFN